MLLHIDESIQRFGSCNLYNVQCFESLNKIGRNFISGGNNSNDSRAAYRGFVRRDYVDFLLDGGFTLSKTIEGRYHTVGAEFLEKVKPLFTANREAMKLIEGKYYSYEGQDYVCRLGKMVQHNSTLSDKFAPFWKIELTDIKIPVNQIDLDLVVPIRIVKLGDEFLLNPYHLYK